MKTINASEILKKMPRQFSEGVAVYGVNARAAVLRPHMKHTPKGNPNRCLKFARTLFSQVCSDEHWKKPFEVQIIGNREDAQKVANLVQYVAMFFFGGDGHEISIRDGVMTVVSPGYQCW